jgi:hypothetical protein
MYGARKTRDEVTNWDALYRAAIRGYVRSLQDYRWGKRAAGTAVVPGRWIVMGRLTAGHYVRRGNGGFPNGYLMTWHGRTTPGTPWEFLNWLEVERTVYRRLQLRGLKLKAIALDAKRDGQSAFVHVLVARFYD